MIEGSSFAHLRRRSSVHDCSFPAVNVVGDRICKNYGIHEGQDVTNEFYENRDRRRNSVVLDINIYDIKDHSFKERINTEQDNIIDKLTKRRKSLVLGSVVPKGQISKSTPTLLEQSQTFRGLRKQISNRLRGSTVRIALPDPKHRNKRIDSKSSASKTKNGSEKSSKLSSSTIFLKSRGIHVHVIPSPKEAIRKEIVERNSPEKRLAKIDGETQLLVTGVPSNNVSEEDNKRSEISSYAIRQQYGQHLEKNWFKSLVREMQSKSKDSNQETECPFTPEMFYSPEPESDSETAEDQVPDQINFRNREPCRSRPNSDFGNLVSAATKFASMDVMLSDGDSHDDSDIELVLKNGTLIEKRVKDKMYQKRERKLLRFQQFMNNSEKEVEVDSVMDIEHISDKELRAMRLKLKKRTWKTKLKGIERFRQLVRNIQVALYFSRKLKTIRRQRREFRRRGIRHKSLGGFNSDDDDFDRVHSHLKKYKCLKEKFLDELGWKLIEDVNNLCIKDGFGYDRREELASGERCSRFTLVLHDWFHIEHENNEMKDRISFIDGHINKTLSIKSSTKKRSPSCPELIKSKEFRVLFNDSSNEKRTLRTKSTAMGKPKGVLKSKNVNTLSSKRNGLGVEGAIGHLRFKRRNSLTMDKPNTSGRLNLRDLLKDVDIPAKEIKIQIAERKMRKQKTRKSRAGLTKRGRPRDAKEIIEADRFKIPEYDLVVPDLESSSTFNESYQGRTPHNKTLDQGEETQIHSSFSIRKCTYLNSGVSWNKTKSSEKETWSNEELDKEIANVGSLFLEMRHCRYIRWNPLRQAIVDRMFELETKALQSKNK